MTRIPAALFVLLLALAVPARAQDVAVPVLTPEALAAQNLAIATSVQTQLLACWHLPAGYEGRSISVRLAFFGDGTLDGEPAIEPHSIRAAGKYPVFMQSIAAAIASCLPFLGLEALGAQPGERFDITVHFRS
jgi:hypothetical protein